MPQANTASRRMHRIIGAADAANQALFFSCVAAETGHSANWQSNHPGVNVAAQISFIGLFVLQATKLVTEMLSIDRARNGAPCCDGCGPSCSATVIKFILSTSIAGSFLAALIYTINSNLNILELNEETQDQVIPCMIAAYTLMAVKYFTNTCSVTFPRRSVCCTAEGSAASLVLTSAITMGIASIVSMSLMAAVFSNHQPGFANQTMYGWSDGKWKALPNSHMAGGAGFAAAIYCSCAIYLLIAASLTGDYVPRPRRARPASPATRPVSAASSLLHNRETIQRTNSANSIIAMTAATSDYEPPTFRAQYTQALRKFIAQRERERRNTAYSEQLKQ